MKTAISTNNAPAALGPYSQGIVSEQGKTVYVRLFRFSRWSDRSIIQM